MAIRTAVVPVSELFQLRWSVLRPGLPPETAVFAEDADPETFHIAARDESGVVRGCATFIRAPLPDGSGFPGALGGPGTPAVPAAYRLRGMAGAPETRGRGYGTAVLGAGLAEARSRGAALVWCNGRTSARGFYEHHGFTAVGGEFHVEHAGPHLRFVAALGTAEGTSGGTGG